MLLLAWTGQRGSLGRPAPLCSWYVRVWVWQVWYAMRTYHMPYDAMHLKAILRYAMLCCAMLCHTGVCEQKTLLFREPWPRDPAAEAAIQPQIWCFQS